MIAKPTTVEEAVSTYRQWFNACFSGSQERDKRLQAVRDALNVMRVEKVVSLGDDQVEVFHYLVLGFYNGDIQ